MVGCPESNPPAQKTFPTPEAAAQAFLDALERDDADALREILGRQYEDQIVTPDWDSERAARQKIASAAVESLEFEEIDGDGRVQLIIGEKRWPAPIPLVREEDGWRFDTEAGIEEMTDRRIGRNELSAIAITNAYVDAQIEYAREDRDGDDVLEFAQRLASSPGTRDGLYWESESDDDLSPFGPLVEGAEHYLDTLEPGDPIKGYYFQVLTRQGQNPPGGRYDYVINGNMIAGFGLVAYPADHGSSGIMTFVVSHRGKIYQKDLGAFTEMDAYDPDESWSEIEE